jgi:hypothetical protein
LGQTYTFVAFRADGGSPFLDVRVFEDAEALESHARELLDEHRSCVRVEVWDGSDRLLVIGRDALAWDEGAPT